MENRELNLMKVLLIFVLIASVIPAASSIAEVGIPGLNISMILVNQREGSSKKVMDRDVELTTERITFKESDTIDNLLISKGILPDGESLGILYKINPGIDEKTIQTNATLTVPAIKGMKDIPIISKEGYLVALTLDKEMKQDFLKVLRALDNSVEQIGSVPAAQFGSPADKGKFTQTVKSLAEKMDAFGVVLKERTRPLSSEMIRQIHNESKQLDKILTRLIKEKQMLRKSDLEIVELIVEDMDVRMKTLDEKKGPGGLPSASPEMSVIVRTIDTRQGTAVNNLRIYYVPQALWATRKDFEESFDKLTSPADRILPEANYYIWAGKPNDSTPLGEKKLLKVRKTPGKAKIELDLAIN